MAKTIQIIETKTTKLNIKSAMNNGGDIYTITKDGERIDINLMDLLNSYFDGKVFDITVSEKTEKDLEDKEESAEE